MGLLVKLPEAVQRQMPVMSQEEVSQEAAIVTALVEDLVRASENRTAATFLCDVTDRFKEVPQGLLDSLQGKYIVAREETIRRELGRKIGYQVYQAQLARRFDERTKRMKERAEALKGTESNG